MTTQTNTIINKFKSEGAQKVVKDTERVGRAQTRLGQASASSGRQFAAQASGLGGLVAAYAGAAATVFALTAAFDALARSARAETILQGTKTLALEIGQSGPKIIAEITKITQGQLELSEAAQNANIALSSGFNTDQIRELTKISLGASRALGRDLNDAFTRLTRGAAKLEPELLDELGIFVRIEPAVEAYAAKLNIAASQLTQFERRQAFLNAIIDEGTEKFSNIDVSSASTQKSLEQLQASIQTLALEFGQLVANVLKPVVDFFKNDFGNVLLVFGGILTLVFGKAISLLGGFVASSLNATAKYADDLAARSEASKKTTQSIIADQEKLNKVIAARPPTERLGGEAGFQRGVTRDVSSEAAAARRRFLSGETLSPGQRAKDIKTLTQAQNQLTQSGRASSKAFSDADTIIKSYTKAAQNATLKTKALNVASITLAGSVRILGTAFIFLNRALVVIGTLTAVAQLVGQIFGIDVIGKISDFFSNIKEQSEQTKKGLIGLSTAAIDGKESIFAFAESIGFTQTELENIPEIALKVAASLEELGQNITQNRKVDPALQNSLEDVQFNIEEIVSTLGLFDSQLLGLSQKEILAFDTSKLLPAAVDQIKNLQTQITLEQNLLNLLNEKRNALYETAIGEARIAAINFDRLVLEDELAKNVAERDFTKIKNLQLQIELQERAIALEEKLGTGLTEFVGGVAQRAGIPEQQFVDTLVQVNKLKEEFPLLGSTFKNSTQELTFFGVEIKKTNGQIGDLSDEQKDFVDTGGLLLNTLIQGRKAFDNGSTSAEKLSQQIVGIQTSIKQLEALGVVFTPEEGLLAILDDLIEKRDDLRAIGNLIAGIRKEFGGVSQALDAAVFKGLVDLSGGFAANSQEAAKNQADLLRLTIESTNETQALVDSGKQVSELNEKQQEQLAARVAAEKALAGEVLKIFQESEKILKAEKLRTIQLQNQIDKLREQTELLQLQNQLAQDQAIQKAQIEALERSVNIDEKRFDLAKQITKTNEDQFSAQQKLNDLKNQELQIQRDIADIQFQTQLSQAEAARGTESTQLASSVARQLEDPRTTSREAFDLRKSLLDLERAQADDIQREQAELAERTYQNELAVIGARKVQLLTELDNLETKTQQAEIATLREKELLDQRQAIEIQKINNERDLLKQRFDVDLKTAANALNDIDRREALFEAQQSANEAQIATFGAFLSGIDSINDGPFVAAITEFVRVLKGDEAVAAIESRRGAGDDLLAQARSSLSNASSILQTNAALQGEIFDAERTNATSKLAQIGNIFAIEDQALVNKLADTETLQKIERDALAQTQLARLAEIEAQRQQIQQQLSNEDLLGQKAYEQLQAKLLGLDVERAATEDALDLRLQSLKDEYDVIRQLNLEIAGIVKSNLTDAFMDLNTAFIEGELTFKGVADGFRDLLGSMLREIQAAVFRKTIVDPLVGSIVKAVPVFGTSAASGGRIEKKASGGLLRDRVPALLEPGEFVVSRRGAKAIGLANLQEINSGISDDAESILLASLFSKKVKGMASGGKMTQEQLVAAQIKRERSLKSQRPTSTVKDLESFGLGSEGIDLMNLMPGSFFGKALSQAFGFEIPSFVVGKTAAPQPSTFKEFEELERTKANIESKIGVSPTQTKGFVPGAVDPVTGGIFNSAGQAVNIDAFGRMGAAFGPNNTPSYTNFGSFVNAVMTPGNMAPLQGSIPGGPTNASFQGGLGAGGSQYGGPKGGGGGSYGGYSGSSAGSDGFSNAPRASGGMITRMAAGGQVRDRVPALLEPGEFVIRRPAAKAIGGAALGAMNATGKSTPNISVNVNNQGVPKNVSVAPPRINGDKVILDIITRDLRNNGAIKKTMRRGK